MQPGLTSDPVPHHDFAALTATAVTTDQTSADFFAITGKGVKVVIVVTSAGTGSVTPHIQAKDAGSNTYYDLLVGTAITSNGTTVLTIYPGLTPVANVTASDVLPHTWRVQMKVNNSNTMTYTVGASILQ